ncbi:efflux RND transporter periplasmic adaptor subunit [Biformimicrobium ophioploci]|uniref:Efflux RND transporter periplasmic adaptor subunit n=1 Tax=Biformimicrobium ophioploci TaxID=3036711 RepID=A0ABQ6LY99_9GAMM|nr:efflux RND transporter periplasmic adaptor subunit [Microbulbifer sp. NKW57]GMG87049.1 efflux RND transporter periplasmic adaptor subunit [Microbulbifer sp. NKW57]
MSDTSSLLNQLKIDREEEAPAPAIPIKPVFLTALGTALVTASITAALLSGPETSKPAPITIETGEKIAEPGANTAPAPSGIIASDEERILNASGYITARRMATVSAETMGLITAVNVEEGMSVSEGEVLATLDDSVARVSLQLAEAQVEVLQARRNSVQAQLTEAQRRQQRLDRISSRNLTSEAERTATEAEVARLQASLESAGADIKVAKLEVQRQRERLEDHTIRAPFSGIVTVKNAQPGEIVAPSSAGGGFTRTGICTLVDMASLEIEVDVNEAFIGRVSTGQKVIANLDAYPEWDIPASVIAIIPTADRAKATVRVRIRIDANDSRILPDMGVKVAFLQTS